MPANVRRRNVGRVAAARVGVSVVGAGLIGIGLCAPAAYAQSGNHPAFQMTWSASNDTQDPFTYNPAEFGTVQWGTWDLGGPAGDRTRTGWQYVGGLINEAWELDWTCVVNDRMQGIAGSSSVFVDAMINVTNTSATSQVFWVYMPLALGSAIGPQTLMSGSVSAALSASTSSGAFLSAAGTDPVFQAYIDTNPLGGVGQQWLPPYTLLAPAFGAANDTISFSNALGPIAHNEIAIGLRFELSPGDSASVTGIFEIAPIPGPGGLAVLALAGVVGVSRRR